MSSGTGRLVDAVIVKLLPALISLPPRGVWRCHDQQHGGEASAGARPLIWWRSLKLLLLLSATRHKTNETHLVETHVTIRFISIKKKKKEMRNMFLLTTYFVSCFFCTLSQNNRFFFFVQHIQLILFLSNMFVFYCSAKLINAYVWFIDSCETGLNVYRRWEKTVLVIWSYTNQYYYIVDQIMISQRKLVVTNLQKKIPWLCSSPQRFHLLAPSFDFKAERNTSLSKWPFLSQLVTECCPITTNTFFKSFLHKFKGATLTTAKLY